MNTYKCLYCGTENKLNKNCRGKYCNNSCQMKHKSDINYEKYLKDNSIADGFTHMRNYKNRFLEEQNHLCDICKNPDIWNGKQIIFILDHIDGKSDNNHRNNLRLICPNCDSQLDTYKYKNKNRDRAKYRKVISISERK